MKTIFYQDIKEKFDNFKSSAQEIFENLKENELIEKIIKNPNFFLLSGAGLVLGIKKAQKLNLSENTKNARTIFNYFKRKGMIKTDKSFNKCFMLKDNQIVKMMKKELKKKMKENFNKVEIPHVDFIVWAEENKLLLIEAKSTKRIGHFRKAIKGKFENTKFFIMLKENLTSYDYSDIKAIIFTGNFLKSNGLEIDENHRLFKMPRPRKRKILNLNESDFFKLDNQYVYGFKAEASGIIDKNTL